MRSSSLGTLWLVAVLVTLSPFASARAASVGHGPWPMTSEQPVLPLDRPRLQENAAELGVDADDGARFVIFGDQRALADGEWQAMNQLIVRREQLGRNRTPLLAILDTGDIVFDGSFSDQYHMLTGILEPLRAYPYLVGAGNHEVQNNQPGPARGNLVRFLGPSIGDDLTVDRLYYRRDVAGIRLLFLDTNELVYGPDGDFTAVDGLTYRGRAQLRWLAEELADSTGIRTTIAVLHHPLVSSSEKHRAQSAKLWSLAYEGRTLPQILAEGGVDLVLTGHTHTYERFRLVAPGGQSFQLMNVSGRPRGTVWWIGKGARMAHDISGREAKYFRRHGWRELEGWQFEQLDAMLGSGANQWVELHVAPDGGLSAEVFYLVDEGRGGARSEARFGIE